MSWAPEAKPWLELSIERRFKIRRTARGYAIYDHFIGEMLGEHLTLEQAVKHKRVQQRLLRQTRDS